MKKILILCLFVAGFAMAAKKSVAVFPCYGNLEESELKQVRFEINKIGENILLQSGNFKFLLFENLDKGIDQQKIYNACKEGGTCVGDLTSGANADYGTWCQIDKTDEKLILYFQLFDNEEKSNLYTNIFRNLKDIEDVLTIMDKEISIAFKRMLPKHQQSASAPSFAGGIDGVQIKGTDYEFAGEKRYLTNITTEPVGAVVSFNGVAYSSCKETPCKVELREGNVRIIANLEQYEIADTTVSIKQNNQSINIRLKANFGVLEIKPAYLEGIGNDERWSLTINGKAAYSWENRLSPNKYKVELSHRCYEAIGFEAGINKDKREVFDMASHIRLKKGGLVLSAEADDEPIGESVFVNGKQVGETPFSGSVPVCAKIEIGAGKEDVNVKIKHNESVKYTHKMNTEERRRRLAAEQQARQEAAERELELEKEQVELAIFKGTWITFGGGFMRRVLIEDTTDIGFFFINPELVSVADGHLKFGVDVDLGIWLFRGGTSATLSFFHDREKWQQLYLTAGASWYVDKQFSGPLFSVGCALNGGLFVGLQYSIIPMNNRNVKFFALKVGISIPTKIIK